jgi:hypothetical protein
MPSAGVVRSLRISMFTVVEEMRPK